MYSKTSLTRVDWGWNRAESAKIRVIQKIGEKFISTLFFIQFRNYYQKHLICGHILQAVKKTMSLQHIFFSKSGPAYPDV